HQSASVDHIVAVSEWYISLRERCGVFRHWQALPSQRRFVDTQALALEQPGVSRDIAPWPADKNIAWDNLCGPHRVCLPITSGERRGVHEAFEGVDGLFGLTLGDIANGRVHRHDPRHHERIGDAAGQ